MTGINRCRLGLRPGSGLPGISRLDLTFAYTAGQLDSGPGARQLVVKCIVGYNVNMTCGIA